MKILILALTIAVVSCCSPKPPESPKNGERCAGAGEASITTASGTKAPVAARYCKGDVIFEENFNELNEEIWKHEETLSGGPVRIFYICLYLFFLIRKNYTEPGVPMVNK